MPNYLADLTFRLAAGASSIDPPARDAHADWIRRQMSPGGGFAGRDGPPDPYYTAFALRSLWILDQLDDDIAVPTAEFLRDRLRKKDSIVDLMSLIFAAAILELACGQTVISDDDASWRDKVADLLHSLRCPDGGFAKTPEGRAGSTYQTFLSVLCYELMGVDIPDVDAAVRFIHSQKQPDGGYREIRVAKRAGVNPTAAAIGTLRTLGCLDIRGESDTIEFLVGMQTAEGGLTANTRIPFADLLSTCTGAITLTDLIAMDQINLGRMRRYVESMQARDANQNLSGGFLGFELDQTTDVEYTFYGIASLSLLGTV